MPHPFLERGPVINKDWLVEAELIPAVDNLLGIENLSSVV